MGDTSGLPLNDSVQWQVFIKEKQLKKGQNKCEKAKINTLEIAANGPREHV
jgi:hypothetical protein